MPLKDILIVVSSPSETAAFAAAEALSKQAGAHVTCLQLVQIPDPAIAAAGFTTGIWAEALDKTRERAERDRLDIAKRLAAFESPTEMRQAEGALGALSAEVALSALHKDVTIMQRPEDGAMTEIFEAALFGSGRPVLVAPPRWDGTGIGRRVMVAWRANREAARALGDAAPFLDAADQITVVAVGGGAAYEGDTFAGYDISGHLARHGWKVALRQPDSFGRTTEDALVEGAQEFDADLIVMGGYGHSRAREFILGGVTRSLVRTAPIPILISH